MKKLILSMSLAVAVVCSIVGISGTIWSQESTKVDSSNASEKKVIAVNVSHSYAYDITDINKLYENAELVVTGSVSSIGNAKKDYTMPVACTPAEFQIKNTIKGATNAKTVNILVEGGTITMQDYEDSIKELYPKTLEKEKINTYTAKEKNSTYITYVSDEYEKLSKSQNYVLFLNKMEGTDKYVVIGSSGMIPVDSSVSIANFQDIKKVSE